MTGDVTQNSGSTSVVITTHQRRAMVEELIAKLLTMPGVDEVVVAADGCSDGTDEALMLAAAADPRVKPVFLHPNRGQARARLAAVRAASGALVVSLDDDVWPDAELVVQFCSRMADAAVDVVLGYMPTAVPEVRRPGQFATFQYSRLYERHVVMYERQPERILDTFWAGNFAVRRETYLACMATDPPALAYHEDRELGHRLASVGAVAAFHRAARASHQHARPWRAYIRESGAIGRATVELARLHSLPVELPSSRAAGMRGRILRTLSRSGVVTGAVIALAGALVRFAGASRRFALEDAISSTARDLMTEQVLRRALKDRGVG